MISDAFNFHIDPVRTEMTGPQQISTSHICDWDERESKDIFADKKLLQVCFMEQSESEVIFVDESCTEESES